MIVYGTKSKPLAQENVFDKCSHCSASNSVTVYVFQQYAHVFWIPFFPLKKKGASVCSHCKQALNEKQMPPALHERYLALKAQTKAPLWMFSGIALFAALIIAVVIGIRNDDARNAKYVAAPQAGDTYEVKSSSGQYYLILVEEVKGDSVFTHASKYEVNKWMSIEELKKMNKGEYAEEVDVFSKAALKEMLDKGEISDVSR
jgi:hypothetical protein